MFLRSDIMVNKNDSRYDLFNKVQKKSKSMDSTQDIGFINKDSKNTIIYKGDGSTTNANGLYAQYKTDKESGVATEISLQSNTITVQKDIIANDISINYHKLNSQLYELTNMKQVMDTSIGNLTMMGTVLVKTYEPTLKKWVLMRRQVRIPIFSNLLDSVAIDDKYNLNISDTLNDSLQYKIDKNNK